MVPCRSSGEQALGRRSAARKARPCGADLGSSMFARVPHEPEESTQMTDGRRLIVNIGVLLDGPDPAARERLIAAGAVVTQGRGATEEELLATCAEAEIVMGLGQFPFSARVFEGLPRFEFLMQCTVGYDQVDVGAATRHGV